MITRRALLAGTAALVVARKALAIGPGTKFRFGQLQLGTGGSWNPRPNEKSPGSAEAAFGSARPETPLIKPVSAAATTTPSVR